MNYRKTSNMNPSAVPYMAVVATVMVIVATVAGLGHRSLRQENAALRGTIDAIRTEMLDLATEESMDKLAAQVQSLDQMMVRLLERQGPDERQNALYDWMTSPEFHQDTWKVTQGVGRVRPYRLATTNPEHSDAEAIIHGDMMAMQEAGRVKMEDKYGTLHSWYAVHDWGAE